MKTIRLTSSAQLPTAVWPPSLGLKSKTSLYVLFSVLIVLFAFSDRILQVIDPKAAGLDIGIYTLGLFGLVIGLGSVIISLWLQELLWKPFKTFRKNFNTNFNQLSAWQQCVLYFSVFFLLLFAIMGSLQIVF